MTTLRELLGQEAEPSSDLVETHAYEAYARALAKVEAHENNVQELAKAVYKAERNLTKAENELRLAEHVLSALLDVEV
jgi:hypothetical protein